MSKGPDSEVRPWGRFDVVSRFSVSDETGATHDVVIKRIEITAGKRLSYQSHEGRDEQWYVVSGTGFALVSGHESEVKPGDSIHIKKGERHRIGSTSQNPLIFIEIATGHVDEDDIVRYEDDFGRVA